MRKSDLMNVLNSIEGNPEIEVYIPMELIKVASELEQDGCFVEIDDSHLELFHFIGPYRITAGSMAAAQLMEKAGRQLPEIKKLILEV